MQLNGRGGEKQFLIAYRALTTALQRESRKGGKTHDNEQNEKFYKKPETLSYSVRGDAIQPLRRNTGGQFSRSKGDRGNGIHEY